MLRILAPRRRRTLHCPGPEPHDRLPLRREKLRGHRGDLVRRDRIDLGQHPVERAVLVVVENEAGQPAHPGARAFEREHDLPLQLLLPVGQLGRRQPLAGEPGVFTADGLDRGVRRARLGADVDAELPGRLVEVLVGEDRVGQAQLLADPLEQPARHPAAEDVGEDREGEAPRVAQRERVGTEDDVGLGGIALLPPLGAPHGRRGRDWRARPAPAPSPRTSPRARAP